MTDRDSLIELLDSVQDKGEKYEHTENGVSVWSISNEKLADHILADGWRRLPCKVGEVVWVISHWFKYTKTEIESRKILSVQIYKNGNIQYHYKDGCFWKEHIGRTVFLTKEEAEDKLKEREENDGKTL